MKKSIITFMLFFVSINLYSQSLKVSTLRDIKNSKITENHLDSIMQSNDFFKIKGSYCDAPEISYINNKNPQEKLFWSNTNRYILYEFPQDDANFNLWLKNNLPISGLKSISTSSQIDPLNIKKEAFIYERNYTLDNDNFKIAMFIDFLPNKNQKVFCVYIYENPLCGLGNDTQIHLPKSKIQ